MTKPFFFLSLFIVATLACSLSTNVAPTGEFPTAAVTPIPVIDPLTPTPEVFLALTQAIPATQAPTQPALEGVEVAVEPVSIVLSPKLAGGISGDQIPRADGPDLPYWELTPGHTVLTLQGYLLPDKFHQPQIYVYPAQAYAEMFSGAFESIRRLDNILYTPNGMTVTDDEQLPTVPFFNAAQAFASNIQVIAFQNGGGVRFLTEYAQYAAPVNNHELFYHFEGVTRDGACYIVAILPITAPRLAETSDPGAVIPAGGIAYPDLADPNADFPGYYAAATALLNSTSPEAFTPAIGLLDGLIQSMRITP